MNYKDKNYKPTQKEINKFFKSSEIVYIEYLYNYSTKSEIVDKALKEIERRKKLNKIFMYLRGLP